MSKPSTPGYRTSNWSSDNAALKRRGSLSIWFDADPDWRAARTGKRDHPETFFDQAIQACLTCERSCSGCHCARSSHGNATGPSDHGEGLVASLIKMAGLDWPVPDWSTLCRRQARISDPDPLATRWWAHQPAHRHQAMGTPSVRVSMARRYSLPGGWRMAGAQTRCLGRGLWKKWSGYLPEVASRPR